ncbi:MAG: NAD(P)/FAD-dependent oxidoreductase [Methanotrichaceae archaeon]|nr:NAD(P)/FAD-dependent oxidoreductase [Methanotrichaceae archaeon]
MKCEILVVGASSAGIMATLASASGGAEVVLIDKTFGNINHAANTIFQGMASRSGLQFEKSCIRNKLDGMRIVSPAGNALTIPAQGYFLDRKKFDNFYIQMVRDAGVALLRQEAIGLKTRGIKRSVITNQDEIEADVIIDASGIQSSLARRAGLISMHYPKDIAWAMEAVVEHPKLGEERYFEYFVGSIAPGWKATFSPAGNNKATLGVFVRGYGPEVQLFFRKFVDFFKEYKSRTYTDIDNLKVLSVVCGGDPIAVLPGQIVSDGLMVTGGGAGQSGLAYGMRAGTICGQVAANAVLAKDVSRKFLERYKTSWKSQFYWEYRMGRAALETLRKMDDKEIDRLIRGLSGKNIVSNGSLIEKSFYVAARVALIRPKVVFDLIRNLIKG